MQLEKLNSVVARYKQAGCNQLRKHTVTQGTNTNYPKHVVTVTMIAPKNKLITIIARSTKG